MSLRELLTDKRLKRHRTSADEIAGLRRLIARDLHDADVPGLSPDRTFATAYNAVLQLSKLALACAGYRVSPSLPATIRPLSQPPGSSSVRRASD